MKKKDLAVVSVLALIAGISVNAEPLQGFTLMSGLGQDLLYRGYNIAGQYSFSAFVLEYSHGWDINLSAHLPALSLSTEERNNNVDLHTNWTTGGGLGYFITDALHVHLELKAHNYTENLTGGPSVTYTVYSIGPGIFYDFYIFKNMLIQPVIRYWPNIGNSTGNSTIALTSASGSTIHLSPHAAGFFPNINIGWTF